MEKRTFESNWAHYMQVVHTRSLPDPFMVVILAWSSWKVRKLTHVAFWIRSGTHPSYRLCFVQMEADEFFH